MDDSLTWKSAIIMTAVWMLIALAVGYAFGVSKVKDSSVQTSGTYAEGYEDGLQAGIEAKLDTTLEEWLGRKPAAAERTI